MPPAFRFIGLGVAAARPRNGGIMVAEGRAFHGVRRRVRSRCLPGLALMIAVFCFNLGSADGLRDIVDPQRRISV